MATKKLTRPIKNRQLTGLCAGLANYFDVDPTIVRLATVAVVLITGIVPGIIVYTVGALITPEEGAKSK